ncbi:MAG: hydrogenase formation protein HypD [bacterium]
MVEQNHPPLAGSDDLQQLVVQITTVSEEVGPVRLMEVCGTHTVSLFRSGIRSILPANIRLISGPGCPVCVTSQGYIDAALDLARYSRVAITTYGDMVRVPGRDGSLADLRAQGADVTVCYSARDAVQHAVANPEREVVFLAVGFETTAPATAVAVLEAEQLGLQNFSLLTGHKLVMPALNALLAADDLPVDGFLLPGHVSVIIGSDVYLPLAREHGKACVVAGFEVRQLLLGILHLLRQKAAGQPRVDNVYPVAVQPEGNRRAQELLEHVFQPGDAVWRAMGNIPGSGLDLRPALARFDAWQRYDMEPGEDYEPPGCRCGEVIQGRVDPGDCPLFATACRPESPIGPCMVSSEGSCAAWYRYARRTAQG